MTYYDKYLKYKYKYLQLKSSYISNISNTPIIENSYNLYNSNNYHKYESKNICSMYKEHSTKYYEYIYGIGYNKKHNKKHNSQYFFSWC